jgi:hypothetical protein
VTIRTFFMRDYVIAELHDDLEAAESYLAVRCRDLARRNGGEPVADPVIDWHQIAEGETLPADAYLPTPIPAEAREGDVFEFDRPGIGDWRAIVTVKCEVGG